MSWLSKKLGGNTLKLATVIIGSKVAGEYFYGDSATHGYDISTGSYTAPQYTGDNIFSNAFNKMGITPFKDTSVGKSFVGDAIGFLAPGEGTGSLAGVAQALTGNQRFSQMPSAQMMGVSSGTQGFRGDLGFQAAQAGQLPLGRGGALDAALGRTATQNYLVKKARSLSPPSGSSLPASLATGTSGIRTTSMQRRGYAKVTGS
tara:strand:+ start:1541 stop:2149 length:609 start_codon:yes stop_codon:yes gene_type:complete